MNKKDFFKQNNPALDFISGIQENTEKAAGTPQGVSPTMTGLPQMPGMPDSYTAPVMPQTAAPVQTAAPSPVAAAARKGLERTEEVQRRRLSQDAPADSQEQEGDNSVGRIVSVSGLKVEVLLSNKAIRD